MLFFSEVDTIDPTTVRWSSIRFQRNNNTYRMLISLCQLILEGMLLTEENGEYRLASFIDPQHMNRLYENGQKQITKSLVNKVLNEIIDENEATFQTFMRLITPAQARLLKAIAKEGTVQQALSSSFISKHQLGATSTVRSAIRSLVEKELVLDCQGDYQVYDRFFSLWLNR